MSRFAIRNPYFNPAILYQDAVPQEFSQSDFAKAVAAKLEPAEVGLVVNPLTYTPQMQSRARELTAAATNEAERARLIFDVLVRGGNTNLVLPAKPETAREAYEAWDASASQLGCQESAFLYVALTRALNLKDLLRVCGARFQGRVAASRMRRILHRDKRPLG